MNNASRIEREAAWQYIAAIARLIKASPIVTQVFATHPGASPKMQRFWLRDELSGLREVYIVSREPLHRVPKQARPCIHVQRLLL